MVGLNYKHEFERHRWNYHLELAKQAFSIATMNAQIRMEKDRDREVIPAADVREALTEVLTDVNNDCEPRMMYNAMMEVGYKEFVEQAKNVMGILDKWKRHFS